ncbi:MAG: PA14 domain-containing protein [Ectobacillus sp.]
MKKLLKVACSAVLVSELLFVPIAKVKAETPTYRQTNGEIHYYWGSGGPPGVPADNFNAEFVQNKSLPAGDYFIQAFADDNVKVEMNGQTKLDRWDTYTGKPERTLLPNMPAGNYTIKTTYREASGLAAIFSDVVKFDNWLAYYYPNKSASGYPAAAKVIAPTADKGLLEDHGLNSPAPGKVGADNFSARYVTAKRLPAGYYMIRAGADDGVRVRIDGKLVLDRWNDSAYREDTAVVSLSDNVNGGGNIHWIEVEYKESTGAGKVSFNIKPVDLMATAFKQTDGEVHYNWGWEGPSGYPTDYFNAIFTQNKSLTAGDYFIQTFADDNIKVEVDGQTKLDRWNVYSGKPERALLLNMPGGNHTIKTIYHEEWGIASIFSDVVKFDDWLAYYYPNTDAQGYPAAAEVIAPTADKGLLRDYGLNSPAPGKVGADNFSARYVTAKRIPAGQYIIRAGADDGVRVRVDGKVVLDRWSASAYREDVAKVEISDNENGNIHWIEVDYLEKGGASKVSFTLTPYSDYVNTVPFMGEVFNNQSLSGSSVWIPGDGVSFNWGIGAPAPSVGADNFSAVFHENKNIAAGDYFVQTLADDGVKVELDGKTVINRWSPSGGQVDRAIVPQLSQGVHKMKTSYFEASGAAVVHSHLVPFNQWLAYYYPNRDLNGTPVASKVLSTLSDNHGSGSPAAGKVPSDNFSARYTTAKHMPAGNYKITTQADDGVRVYVDGKLVINRWSGSGGAIDTAVVAVKDSEAQGDVHWIEVEYYEGSGNSFITATVEKTTEPVQSFTGTYKVADMYKENGAVQKRIINSSESFSEAVELAKAAGVDAVLKDDEVVWVKEGFAYADDITINLYSTTSFSNALTYVARGTEVKVEEVGESWVKVRLADTIAYVKKDEVKLVPKDVANASYYKVSNGDLIHYISTNGSYTSYTFGKAPSFLQEGGKYYSVNGYEFDQGQAYQYFNYLSIHSKTNYTAEELNAYVRWKKPESPLANLGHAFKNAEATYNVNAMMLLAMAIHESGYAMNYISQTKYNIFSIRATDRDPNQNADTFTSYEDAINQMAKYYVGLGAGYSNPSDWRYEGAILGNKSTGMNVRYASDAYWGQKIAGHMYSIDKYLGGKDWGKYGLVRPTVDGLNVRSGATTSSAALYQADRSMVLTKLNDEPSWMKVISDVAPSAWGPKGEPAAYIFREFSRDLPVAK